MKKIKLTLLVLIGVYTLLSAQSADESSGTIGQVSIRFNQIVGLNFEYLNKETGSPVDNYDFKISSFSPDIIGSYFIKENTSIRLRFGYNKNSIKGSSVINFSSGSKDTYNYDYRQTNLIFAPGLAKYLKNDRLLFTYGIELPVDFIGKLKIFTEDIYFNAFTGTTTLDTYNVTSDGGIAFGLGAFLGVSYSVFNHFLVGTELFYGIKYLNAGGDVKIESYQNGILDFSQTDEFKVKGFVMTPLKASIIISYAF